MSDELRNLAKAATPGPWTIASGGWSTGGDQGGWIDAQKPTGRYLKSDKGEYVPEMTGALVLHFSERERNTAAFIAAANPVAVLALLDELTALRAKVKAQAEALKPFADLAQHFTGTPDNNWIWRGEEPLEITIGDLRRAAQETDHE